MSNLTYTYEDLFGNATLSSTSEVQFMYLLTYEFSRRGMVLDISGVSYDKSFESQNIEYLKDFLVFKKVLPSTKKDIAVIDNPYYYYFLGFLEDNHTYLDDFNTLRWDNLYFEDFNRENYGQIFYTNDTLDVYGVFVAVKHCVDVLLGVETRTLTLSYGIDSDMTQYMPLLLIRNHLDVFQKHIAVEVTTNEKNLDTMVFYSESEDIGARKPHTIEQKKELLSSQGIFEGVFYVLWEQTNRSYKGTSTTELSARHLVLVKKIDLSNATVTFALFPELRTREENLKIYYTTKPEHRSYYRDLLKKLDTYVVTEKTIPLRDLGISNFFFEEPYFVSPIEGSEKVERTVHVSDEPGQEFSELEFTTPDLVFWIAKLSGIDFDEELFITLYGDSLYEGTPLYRRVNPINDLPATVRLLQPLSERSIVAVENFLPSYALSHPSALTESFDSAPTTAVSSPAVAPQSYFDDSDDEGYDDEDDKAFDFDSAGYDSLDEDVPDGYFNDAFDYDNEDHPYYDEMQGY